MDWIGSSKTRVRLRWWLVGLPALVTVVPGTALGQRTVVAAPIRSGTLSFDGRATLGDFVGTTTTVSGEMTGGPGLAEVRGWVEAPVATLKTGNGRRDKDLNKSMESDRFPNMRFDLDGARTQWERGDSAGVELKGRFTLHGVVQERTFEGTVVFEAKGVRLTASLPLNLKDYKIGGLSKFLGTLKMHPDIVVHVDVVFGKGG